MAAEFPIGERSAEIKSLIHLMIRGQINEIVTQGSNEAAQLYIDKLNQLIHIVNTMMVKISIFYTTLSRTLYNTPMGQTALQRILLTVQYLGNLRIPLLEQLNRTQETIKSLMRIPFEERKNISYQESIKQELLELFDYNIWNPFTLFLGSLLALYPDWLHDPTHTELQNPIQYYLDYCIFTKPYHEWMFLQMTDMNGQPRISTVTFNNTLLDSNNIPSLFLLLTEMLYLSNQYGNLIFDIFKRNIAIPPEIIELLRNGYFNQHFSALQPIFKIIQSPVALTYRNLLSQNISSLFILTVAERSFIPFYFNTDKIQKFKTSYQQIPPTDDSTINMISKEFPTLVNDMKLLIN